jgi:hypothetical protein
MTSTTKRLLVALGIVSGAVMLPTLVFAASDVPPPQGLETGADALFSIDATIVAILLGVIIPILNGIVTKITTSAGVKAVLTLALATVAGLVTTATTDGGDAIFSSALVLNTALTFITSVATYAGLWKPLEVTSSPVTHVDDSGVLVTVPGKLANVGVK